MNRPASALPPASAPSTSLALREATADVHDRLARHSHQTHLMSPAENAAFVAAWIDGALFDARWARREAGR